MADRFNHFKCPTCGKRLFEATPDSAFHIRIRCNICRNVVDIDCTAGPNHRVLALLPKNNELRKCG